jgi:type IV fimbrial biogenesis protein FimT
LGHEERWFVLIHRSLRGFTLVELMVSLAIVGALLAMGVPSMSAMIQNAKLGSATKSYLIGIQTARAEAIRMNVPVDFVLTDAAVAANSTPSANGKNWVVRWTNAGTLTLLDGKAGSDGSGQNNGTSVTVAGTAIAPTTPAFAGVLSFNGFGAVTPSQTLSFDIANPAGGACATAGGPMRCQRIQVRPGGQINVCDPQASAGDSRACPA